MEKPKFSSVKTLRVSEAIAGQLKSAILRGDYKPEEKLPSERELTESFQASRVVVREALRMLELAGFVRIRQGPYGGAYIQRLGYDRLTETCFDMFLAGQFSVRELMQARVHIQPEVARLAAGNVTAAWAQQLEQAFTGEQVPTPEHAEWVRRNLATDDILNKMCGNRFYQAILEPLLRLTQEIVLVVKPKRTIIHDPREHRAIVEAVLRGDGAAAAQSMQDHIRNVESKLIGLEEDYRKRKGVAPLAGLQAAF